uniref:Uncharacterized protein n=1 Tax=Knipowitschia caucasica TaxID=637954 RepID=A0AAV2L7Q7_KNICA
MAASGFDMKMTSCETRIMCQQNAEAKSPETPCSSPSIITALHRHRHGQIECSYRICPPDKPGELTQPASAHSPLRGRQEQPPDKRGNEQVTPKAP